MFRISRIICSAVCLLAAPAGAGPAYGQHIRPPNRTVADIFQTSDRCMACHNGLTTPSGEDVSIGLAWRSTMMANSGRDPYWQAGVRRETMDHPESHAAIEDECSICHMPMARYQAKANGMEGEIFSHLPFDPEEEGDLLSEDGVSCSLCHQITGERLGTPDSFVGGFVVDALKPRGERPEYGPYVVDTGHARIMNSSSGGYQPTESPHMRQSEVCATCHTLITEALGPNGRVIGRLPEQVPYQEWLHSDYKDAESCQSCHMPVAQEATPITRVFGEPRDGLSRHVFVGGNFFIPRILNRFRADLSVAALPQELEQTALRTITHLKSQTAILSIPSIERHEARLEVLVQVQNLGGHKLPTAYPSRRAWLHVRVRDGDNRIVFESGALEPNGSIQGNDNDGDPGRFEPHYREVSASDQVQIYEAIMADSSGVPTTGLLSAVRYVKDNRLLPRGFNKRTAGADIAVRGDAAQDADFHDGGDTIRYTVALGNSPGPCRVDVELWYQPIAYRWAHNLGSYDAFEPRRFVGYYEAVSQASGILLAHATATK